MICNRYFILLLTICSFCYTIYTYNTLHAISIYLYRINEGNIGGPISVIDQGAKLYAMNKLALVTFSANLSINLAVLNMLPIPALDGGQFVFAVLELLFFRGAATQKSSTGENENTAAAAATTTAGSLTLTNQFKKFQQRITIFTFVILLITGLYTIIGDFNRLSN